jgi:hypothetical protein
MQLPLRKPLLPRLCGIVWKRGAVSGSMIPRLLEAMSQAFPLNYQPLKRKRKRLQSPSPERVEAALQQ